VTLIVLATATGTFIYCELGPLSCHRSLLAGTPRYIVEANFPSVTQKDAFPGDQLPADPSKPNLVVLGSGWGSTAFLKNLDTEEFNVTVISPRNYFLFSPLLPSVTVGTLEPRSIIQPTRYITRHKKRRVAVYEAEAHVVDPAKKTVTCSGKQAQGKSVHPLT